MAKKKVTKKKTPASAGRTKAKTAKKPAKKTATKTKKVGKKTPTKKVAKKPPAKKVAKKAPAQKKITKKKITKKFVAKAPTRKKKTVPKARLSRKTVGKATFVTPTPDSDGYVIINGRRVRMMSVSTNPVPVRKVATQTKAAAEAPPETKEEKPVKTKLGKKELEHFRELLLKQRIDLVGDLSGMEKQALQTTGGGPSHMPIHMADIGTDTFDQDFMLGMAETERLRLREIDGALQRIDDHTYGMCEMTSKPIPKARLNAKPWARYTIESALKIERGRGE